MVKIHPIFLDKPKKPLNLSTNSPTIKDKPKDEYCVICHNLGYVFDRKTNTAHTCWMCLRDGRLSQALESHYK